MNNPGVNPTERIFSPQTTCVPQTGVFIARAFNPAVPGTKEEVLALAVQMGAPYGKNANYTLLKPAMKARYGLIGDVTDHLGAKAAYDAVMKAAAAGPCVVGLAGDLWNLTPRWQNVHVGHSVAVLYENGTTGVQLDPVAPAGYMGDSLPPTELAKFATAAIIFSIPPNKESTDMEAVVLRPVKQEWTTGAGDSTPGGQFYTGGPGLGTRKRFNAATRVTSIAETVDAAGLSGPWRVILYGAEILWMPRANLTPIADTRVPAAGFGLSFEGGITQAQLDAAVAAVPKGYTQADLDAARAAGVKSAAEAASAAK